MQLFLAGETLDFVARAIIGPVSKTIHGRQYILIIRYLFSGQSGEGPTLKSTTTHVVSIIVNHMPIPYHIPTQYSAYNGMQLFCTFFATISAYLVIKHLITRVYHAQSNAARLRALMKPSLRNFKTRPLNMKELKFILLASEIWIQHSCPAFMKTNTVQPRSRFPFT